MATQTANGLIFIMSSKSEFKRWALGMAAGTLFSIAAHASTLPATSVNAYVAQSFGATVICNTGGGCSNGGASVSYVTSPAAYVSAHSSANGSTGSVSMVYYFDVIGGSFFDSVPLNIDYNLSVHAGGTTGGDVDDASADIRFSGANGNSGGAVSIFCGNLLRGSTCDAPRSGTGHMTAWVGYTNYIQLDAGTTISGDGFADALADPRISIDPAFLARNPGYSLVLPDSVGNAVIGAPVVGTPEPASLALVGSTLICATLARRRKIFDAIRRS